MVAFTAAQIPDIAGRKYPAELAGKLYPDGIPIFAEADLEKLIKELKVDECVFSYSDIPYNRVMHIGARVNAAGADFKLLGARQKYAEKQKAGSCRWRCTHRMRKITDITAGH